LNSASLLGSLANEPVVRQHVLSSALALNSQSVRDLGPNSPRFQGSHHPIAFPYPLMIRKMIEQGEIRSAKALLAFAMSQGASLYDLSCFSAILAPAVTRTNNLAGMARIQEYAWLIAHGHSYRGEWVALSSNNLLGHSSSLPSLLADLQALGPGARPLIHWIDAE